MDRCDLDTIDDNVVLSANNVMAPFPNNHNIIDVEIDFQSAKPPALNRFMYRDFKSIKLEELLSFLASCDWTPTSRPASGVEQGLDHLTQNIISVIDQLAPLKQFNPMRKGLSPWVDADLQELYRQRDAVPKRYKRTQYDTFRREFQSLAAEAEQRTCQARKRSSRADSLMLSKIIRMFGGNSGVSVYYLKPKIIFMALLRTS